MAVLGKIAVELLAMAAAGFLLAALGPFGTFADGSFANRVAFWLPAMLAAYVIVAPFMVAAHIAARRLILPLPLALAAAVLVSSAPITFVILWLEGVPIGSFPSAEQWFQLYLHVVLISGSVTLLFWLLEPHIGERTDAPALPATSSETAALVQEPPPFLSRLPPHLRDVVALQMEDHYVRAHAAGGSALVLLRMRDAVAEMAGSEGMQVHRSWWVARSAVERVVKDGRNVRLMLRGGIEVPVARSSLAAVRAAGWLD